jgi:hypothetical protein
MKVKRRFCTVAPLGVYSWRGRQHMEPISKSQSSPHVDFLLTRPKRVKCSG